MSHNQTSITSKIAKGAMTRLEIAALYDINPKTLNRRLKRKGIELPSGVVMPADQERIFETLGKPMEG
jgi:hypothetical protein